MDALAKSSKHIWSYILLFQNILTIFYWEKIASFKVVRPSPLGGRVRKECKFYFWLAPTLVIDLNCRHNYGVYPIFPTWNNNYIFDNAFLCQKVSQLSTCPSLKNINAHKDIHLQRQLPKIGLRPTEIWTRTIIVHRSEDVIYSV